MEEKRPLRIAGKTDGFGAQYQAKLSGVALARKEGRCYCHAPFDTMEHLDGGDETVSDMEAFGGMRSDACCNTQNVETRLYADEVHWSAKPSDYYTSDVRRELRDMYDANPKRKTDACEVVIHARRGDSHPSHEYAKRHNPDGDPRFTSDTRLQSTVAQAKARFPDEKVCVFSEGDRESFPALPADVELHLNGSIRDTFHSMVTAPRLVVADSSFSYTAGLLNQNQVYVTNRHWWHRPLDHWESLAE